MAVVEVAPELRGFGGTHGGVLASLALREAELAAGRAPRALSLALLRAGTPGALDVAATLEREGGALSTVALRLGQDGATIALGHATLGIARPGLRRRDRTMPDVPPPEDCAPLVSAPIAEAQGLPIEHRPAADPLPLAGAAEARIAVWMRLRGSEDPVDAAAATVLADGAVPALYAALREPLAMPSAELTLQYAAGGGPSPWVLGVFSSVHAGEGYAVEDAELWTPDGELVLTGRQLRRVRSPRPDGPSEGRPR